jgi:hypothetical protein
MTVIKIRIVTKAIGYIYVKKEPVWSSFITNNNNKAVVVTC